MPGIAPRRLLYPQQEKISARLKELPLSANADACGAAECPRIRFTSSQGQQRRRHRPSSCAAFQVDDEFKALRPFAARSLLSREAVEQPVSASAAQITLTAASLRAARRMGRIPRPRCCIVTQPLAVDMTDHSRALRAARPVAAGSILIWRECATFGS